MQREWQNIVEVIKADPGAFLLVVGLALFLGGYLWVRLFR